MRRKKDTDSSLGLTEDATWATGRTESKTEKVFIETKRESRERVSGATARKLDGLIEYSNFIISLLFLYFKGLLKISKEKLLTHLNILLKTFGLG